jgi:hypothetical protein
VRSLSRDKDKYKIVSEGCAAIRRGKLMGKTFGSELVPVPGGAMLGATPVIVRGLIYWGDILWITTCNSWSKETVRRSK